MIGVRCEMCDMQCVVWVAVYTGIPMMFGISLNPAFEVGEGLHNDERWVKYSWEIVPWAWI